MEDAANCADTDDGSLVSKTAISSSEKSLNIWEKETIAENASLKLQRLWSKSTIHGSLEKYSLWATSTPSGHKKLMRLKITVKIKGPNQGRQFHCCVRPQCHSSNPEARCKWVDFAVCEDVQISWGVPQQGHESFKLSF